MVELNTSSINTACTSALGPWRAIFLILPAGLRRVKSGINLLQTESHLRDGQMQAQGRDDGQTG